MGCGCSGDRTFSAADGDSDWGRWQAAVTFTAPASSGGAPVGSYRVTAADLSRTSRGGQSATSSGTATTAPKTSATVTGLACWGGRGRTGTAAFGEPPHPDDADQHGQVEGCDEVQEAARHQGADDPASPLERPLEGLCLGDHQGQGGDEGEHDGGVAEGEEEADSKGPFALLQQIAGGVVDRGDLVGVERVPQPEGVGKSAGVDELPLLPLLPLLPTMPWSGRSLPSVPTSELLGRAVASG